jgi:hypothetical protein
MDLFEVLKERLDFCKKTTNSREIIIRCPYCGDSSEKHHGHFYIKNEEPFPAMCHRCGYRTGYLSINLIKDLDIISPTLIQLSSTLKKNLKFISNTISEAPTGFAKYTLNYKAQEETDLTAYKLDYIQKRLGIDLTFESALSEFKLILDFASVFEENSLEKFYTMDNKLEKLLNELHDHCVGFLTFDHSHIIFRNLRADAPFRYYAYNLFNLSKELANFYVIPNSIDLLADTEIYLAEGPFDILGIYFHLLKRNKGNAILATANGKYYRRTILHFYRLGFLDSPINIYSDADVDISYFKKLKREIFFPNLNVYYNNIGKDYGLPKEKIQIRKLVI